MSTPYGFPSWTYGYTLCPQTGAQFYQPPGAARGFVPRGRGGGRGQHFGRGGRGGHNAQPPPVVVKPEPVKVKQEEDLPKPVVVVAAVNPVEEKEEGEIVEKPIEEILKGRNAVMFCNDQSKTRSLRMEWEQISETGPPHNKTFTWSLKMGDMMTTGAANSKKGAKNKAAENMARKLDKLPKPKDRFAAGGPPRGGFRGGFFGAAPFYPHVPFAAGAGMPPMQPMQPMPPMPWVNPVQKPQRPKKRKFSETGPAAAATDGPDAKTSSLCDAVKLNLQSLNNPISKLYEFCKQKKLPEPIFETLAENVLEKRKTTKGYVLKKTEFTIQVEVMGKKFIGAAMTKKQAKYNASEAAWADMGVYYA